MQIDEADPMGMEFERCDQGGCYAGQPMSQELTSALSKGKECKVSFNKLDGKTITATLPLRGFTAGYNSL